MQTPGGLEAVSADAFTYTAEVQVHGFSPAQGSIAGGTYVLIRGAGFTEPPVVDFGPTAASDVQLLDSATIAVFAPPNPNGFVNIAVTAGNSLPAVAAERFLYFDPTLSTGGHYGDGIDGSVNVTVLSNNGAPLPDAFVMLNVREEAEFSGRTDSNGQVTLSGPDLTGEQTVTATHLGFSSRAVQAVDAENVTLVLSCIPEGFCSDSSQCREGFVCTCGPPFAPQGTCVLDQFCGVEIETQEQFDAACASSPPPVPFGVITGELTGVEKVDDPGPNEEIMALAVTTQPHPFQASPVLTGNGNVRSDDGPYTVRSRTGEIALIAVCGIFNNLTQEFSPRFIGVQRGLFIVDAQTHQVDVDCSIRLDQQLSIKVPNPPFTPTGPSIYEHVPFLHFGSEGYFGGMVTLRGDEDVLTSTGFAPLEDELSGLDYYILGGALSEQMFPNAVAILEGVTQVDALIVMPEFVPAAQVTQPGPAGVLVDGFFEWQMATDAVPDFYQILIHDTRTVFWNVLVPGDQTTLNLPAYPDDVDAGIFPPGPLRFRIEAVDAIAFDYDNFDDFANLRPVANRRSWSRNEIRFSNVE